MASHHPDASTYASRDGDNRLLWRYRSQRLDAEQARDSILYVTGRLDTTLGGKSVPLRNRQFVFDHTSIDHTRYDSLRRAAYLPVIRNNLYTFFEQFDFPDPTMPTGHRNSTTVAPQALLLLNSDLVIESAEHLARQLTSDLTTDEARIVASTRLLYGREPNAGDIERITQFLHDVVGNGGQASAATGTVDTTRVGHWFCRAC